LFGSASLQIFTITESLTAEEATAMTKRTILATSMLALATISSPAFAYSNVSPKEVPQQMTPAHLQSYSAFSETVPSWTIETDNHHYHGEPKSND
jgi:hypothetical protein